MTRRRARGATLQVAEAARTANEDLFERMGAHAIEIAGSGTEHELIVHFATEPLPRMPATVRALGAPRFACARSGRRPSGPAPRGS